MKIASLLAISAAIILLGAGCGSQKTKVSENGTPSQEVKKAPVVQQSVTINTPKAMPSFTLEEASAHATTTDCWIIAQQNVYDVTPLIKKDSKNKSLIEGCGKESTALLESLTIKNEELKKSIPDYEIGSLAK